MPQLNKGGKYVFGWSVIGAEGTIHFPTMALSEYNLTKVVKALQAKITVYESIKLMVWQICT